MAIVPKSDRTTIITLASASAGPFDLTFRLFDDDALDVLVNDLPRADFTITSSYTDGFDDNATITFNATLAIGDVIRIHGDLTPGRADDFVNGPNLTEKMNIELGRLWSAVSEIKRDTNRSPKFFQRVSPIALEAGRSIIGNDAGNGVKMGPTADEIANAQDHASAAGASAGEAANSAIEAALYDGPKSDTFADLASVTPDMLADQQLIRCIENGAVYRRVLSGGDLNYTGSGGVMLDLVSRNNIYAMLALAPNADGVTDDKAKLDLLNTAGAVVDLGGKTYAYTGSFSPVARFINGQIISTGRTYNFEIDTQEAVKTAQQPRCRLNYNTADSVRVDGIADQFALAGFRIFGRHLKERGPLKFNGLAAGVTNAVFSETSDLAFETSVHAANWYAPFMAANDADANVSKKLVPFFRAGAVTGSDVQLAQGGESDGDTVTATTYTGLATNALVGVDCLVITEGRLWSGRVTTVTANTNGQITLADVGTVGPNDWLLVAPPGFAHYHYLGSYYHDTESPRNMADTGSFVGSYGSNMPSFPASGAIATATRYSWAGMVSPLATGVFAELTYTINNNPTASGDIAHTFSHDSSNHITHNSYVDKRDTNARIAVDALSNIPFSAEQASWIATGGSLAAQALSRTLGLRGWIEP